MMSRREKLEFMWLRDFVGDGGEMIFHFLFVFSLNI